MDQMIICRCEEVSLQEIRDTALQDLCSAREIKLRTRAGMGYCGGRICRNAIDAILRDVTGKSLGRDEIPLKIGTPIRPVTLRSLGSEAKIE